MSSLFSLLMIDIDHFKDYNDSHGHYSGDIALRKIAESIDKSLLRETDLAARFGGEEFVVLLPATDTTAALAIAEGIRMNIKSLRIQHDASDATSLVTVSIGVATLQAELLNKTDLLKQADKALYIAKQAGRNCCQVFSAE